MSFDFSVEDIKAVAKDIHDIHDMIAGSYIENEGSRIASTLESSSRKLDLWVHTWLVNPNIESRQPEKVWGSDGWIDIQVLLREILVTSKRVKEVDEPLKKKAESRPWWKKSWIGGGKNETKNDNRSRSTLNMALTLDKRIDELWAYSDVTFDSLHPTYAQLQLNSRSKNYERSVAVRQSAVVLYIACQQSKRRCFLDIDFYGQSTSQEHQDNNVQRASLRTADKRFNTIFRLVMDDQGTSQAEELYVESLLDPDDVPDPIKPRRPNVELLRRALPDRVICLESKVSKGLFKCKEGHVKSTAKLHYERLQTILSSEKRPPLRKRETLSLAQRLELANRYAESCYELLGTPWLADVRSSKLHRVTTQDGKTSYVWGDHLASLDDLQLENPTSLSESSQLFRVGILLIEIALGGIHQPNHTELQDPCLWASRFLPEVQMVAGTQYSKACEFCIKEHGSTISFHRPEKYAYPDESGWSVYLYDLLQQYESEVLSRCVPRILHLRKLKH